GGVQDRPAAGQHQVRLLLYRGERPSPAQVELDAAVGCGAAQAQPPQRLDDLDPVAADLLLEAALGQGVGEPHAPLAVAAPSCRVRVDPAQGWGDPAAGEPEDLPRSVVPGEGTAGVEVWVGRG